MINLVVYYHSLPAIKTIYFFVCLVKDVAVILSDMEGRERGSAAWLIVTKHSCVVRGCDL